MLEFNWTDFGKSSFIVIFSDPVGVGIWKFLGLRFDAPFLWKKFIWEFVDFGGFMVEAVLCGFLSLPPLVDTIELSSGILGVGTF
jgi:hypothetical protein